MNIKERNIGNFQQWAETKYSYLSTGLKYTSFLLQFTVVEKQFTFLCFIYFYAVVQIIFIKYVIPR